MISLKSAHTFGIDSYCKRLQSIQDVNQLSSQFSANLERDFLVLGDGSNCIFVENYPGTVLHIGLRGIQVAQKADHTLITVAAGEKWHEFVAWCLQHNYYGLENLALIPGQVGAAPIQNIGAYGVEVSQFIESVDFWMIEDATSHRLSNEECRFAYRDSIFKRELLGRGIVTQVTFKLPTHWIAKTNYAELKDLSSPIAQDIFDKVVSVRQKKLPDPVKIGNAGSFFKNPVIDRSIYQKLQNDYPSMPSYSVGPDKVKVPAAWLIDSAGFKSKRYGDVVCHPSQALVLTNIGRATGEDVLLCARDIIETLQKKFGIRLEPEVRLIGESGLMSL